jgi:hypothetical protein
MNRTPRDINRQKAQNGKHDNREERPTDMARCPEKLHYLS